MFRYNVDTKNGCWVAYFWSADEFGKCTMMHDEFIQGRPDQKLFDIVFQANARLAHLNEQVKIAKEIIDEIIREDKIGSL